MFERKSANEVVYGVQLGAKDVWILVELSSDSRSLLPIPTVGSIYFVYTMQLVHMFYSQSIL